MQSQLRFVALCNSVLICNVWRHRHVLLRSNATLSCSFKLRIVAETTARVLINQRVQAALFYWLLFSFLLFERVRQGFSTFTIIWFTFDSPLFSNPIAGNTSWHSRLTVSMFDFCADREEHGTLPYGVN